MPESRAFRDWLAGTSAALDWDALFDYRRAAPARGADAPDRRAPAALVSWPPAPAAATRRRSALHDSVTLGCLGMDTYAFGAGAAVLQAALR